MLYADTDDIYFAYERLVQHKKSSRAYMPTNKKTEQRAGPPAQGYLSGGRDFEPRTAHNMALRFKNHEKLTGKLSEDLPEHINNYIDAAQDYSLDQTNKRAGQEVLLHQERSKEWIGLATIKGVRDKILDVKSNDGQWHNTMNMKQVKPYVRESPEPTDMLSRDEFLTAILEPFKSVNRPKSSIFDVKVTEVIKPGDPKSSDERFIAAKKKELNDLIEKGN